MTTHNTNLTRRQEIETTLVLGALSVLVGYLADNWMVGLFVGAGLILVTLVLPVLVRPLFSGVIWSSEKIGKVMSLLLLFAIYWVAFVPIGLYRRVTGKVDPAFSPPTQATRLDVDERTLSAKDFKTPW